MTTASQNGPEVDVVLSDELVESTAKAMADVEWSWLSAWMQQITRDEARAALTSAYPAIRQQVAEEIAAAIQGEPSERVAAKIAREVGAGTATARVEASDDIRARIIADLTTRRAQITEGRPGWVYLTEAIEIARETA